MDQRRYEGLIAIQRAVSVAHGELQATIRAIVNQRAVMPHANGVVVELRDGDHLYYAAASGTSAPMVGLRLPLASSLSGMSILTNQPLACDDSENDSRVNRRACRQVGLRSMIVVPIPHNGQAVGVLKFHASEVAAFSDEDRMIAQLLVGPITMGFARADEKSALDARAELETVVRMKEHFISTVNHELRTPLTSIAGALALLDGGAAGGMCDRTASLVGIAARNADRLKRLVNDLLDIDRLNAGKLSIHPVPTDLAATLRDVVRENEPFAREAGVSLALEVPADGPIATTDPDRLVQAVTNLLSNGAKFSPAGSTVTLSLVVDGGAATIRVVDQGPGVPIAFRPLLFTPFAQAIGLPQKHGLPGTGLGLAIAKGVVEQLGGTLKLDESHTDGAAFEIRLPIDPPLSQVAAA